MHEKSRILVISAAIAVVASAAVTLNTQHASALTINFAPLAQNVNLFNDIGTTYSQDGFTFTEIAGPFGNRLGAWCTCSANNPVGGIPATSLVPYYAGSTVNMTSAGGNFSLQSIDLASWGENQGVPGTFFDVTFDGHLAGGGDVLQTFSVQNVAGSPVLNTYVFSGFDNLTQLSVVQAIFNSGDAFQFNNIVVGAPSETPLPAALPLFATGLGAMGFLARRKKKKTVAKAAA